MTQLKCVIRGWMGRNSRIGKAGRFLMTHLHFAPGAVRVSEHRRKLCQVFGKLVVDLLADSSGSVFLFLRCNPAGNDVVSIYLR